MAVERTIVREVIVAELTQAIPPLDAVVFRILPGPSAPTRSVEDFRQLVQTAISPLCPGVEIEVVSHEGGIRESGHPASTATEAPR